MKCRACNAPIMFVTTKGGKSMPVDAKPEKRMVKSKRLGYWVVVDTHTSHFATCTDPDRFRKGDK